jgi:hypothetical protein
MVSAIGSLAANSTRSAMVAPATFVSSGSRAVPPLPGATNTFATRGDLAIFHASACSRPPPPTTRMFIRYPREDTPPRQSSRVAHPSTQV